MALYKQYSDGTYRWAIWKVDEPEDELRRMLPDDALRRQAGAFGSASRRLEWMAVRVLLYELLHEYKEIGYHPSGKPYLADHSHYISISHTRGYVALILGDTPVGIDIERYGQRVHRVADRFVDDGVEQLPAFRGDRTWSLLLHWSAKEVMFKCMDSEEVDFRKHLHVVPFEVMEEGCFRAYETRTEHQRAFDIHYMLHPDFVLTWQAG